MEDNSLQALSFDFLGVFERRDGSGEDASEAAKAAVGDEGNAGHAGNRPEDGPGGTAVVAGAGHGPAVVGEADRGEAPAGVVSAPRRHLWGALYVIRAAAVAVVVFAVGSLVLTLMLNPELTFEGAVALMAERVGGIVERVGGLLS